MSQRTQILKHISSPNKIQTKLKVLFCVWLLTNVADVILSNIYGVLFIRYYLLINNIFPVIIIYFIVAFILILLYSSYIKLDYKSTSSTHMSSLMFRSGPVCCDIFSCDLLLVWLPTIISVLLITSVYGLSPLFYMPFLIYFFAWRGRERILDYPYAPHIFGSIHYLNQQFEYTIGSNNKYYEKIYLKCLFRTIFHLICGRYLDISKHSKQFESQDEIIKYKEFYINILMKINDKKQISNIYNDQFCDAHFEMFYLLSSIDGYRDYAFGYFGKLIFIYLLEVILFWTLFYIPYYDQYQIKSNMNILRITWITRDILYFILLLIIFKLYLDTIVSEIKFNFSWLDPTLRNIASIQTIQCVYTINSESKKYLTECWILMYDILWADIITNDKNILSELQFIKKLIVDYCVGDIGNKNDSYSMIYNYDTQETPTKSHDQIKNDLRHLLI
eukprot:273554_1